VRPISSERLFVCSWCEQHSGQLILVPTPQSGAKTRYVRYPADAGIVGRVTAVTMPIDELLREYPDHSCFFGQVARKFDRKSNWPYLLLGLNPLVHAEGKIHHVCFCPGS